MGRRMKWIESAWITLIVVTLKKVYSFTTCKGRLRKALTLASARDESGCHLFRCGQREMTRGVWR